MKHLHNLCILGILITLQLSTPAHGQKLKGLLKKAKEKAAAAIQNSPAGLTKLGSTIIEQRQEAMDTAAYNYAIDMTDNAAFFSNQTAAGKLVLNLGEGISRSYSDEMDEEDIFEHAMDLNREGEQLYQLRKYKLAGYHYLSALLLYADAMGNDTEAGEMNPFKKGWGERMLKILVNTEAYTGNFDKSDYFAYTRTLDNVGQFLLIRGRYLLAEEVSSKALSLRIEAFGKSHPATAASYNNTAVLFHKTGKFSKAEEYLNFAVEFHQEKFGKESKPYALSLNNLAMLEQSLGRYEKAKQHMQECISILEKDSKTDERDLTYFKVNLALMHQNLEEYGEAEAIYASLQELYKGVRKYSEQNAYVLSHAASLNLSTGKTEEAKSMLEQALDIYERRFGEASVPYANALGKLGRLHAYNSNWSMAISKSQEAFQLKQGLLNHNHPDYLQSMEDVAVAHWNLQNYDSADAIFNRLVERRLAQLEDVFPAMNEYEKGRYWETIRPSLMVFYNYAVDRKKENPQLLNTFFGMHSRSKGLLLSTASKVKSQILNGGNEELKTQYLQWIDQKEQLAVYYTYSGDELKEEGISLDSLEQASQNSEKALTKASADFSDAYSLPKSSFSEVRSRLADKEAAIEIVQLPEFKGKWTGNSLYVALIVTKEKEQPTVVVLEDGNALENKFAKFYRKAITNQIEEQYSYPTFWKPIEEQLTSISKAYISVDGVFNQLNINTFLRDDKKHVLDVIDLSFVSSSRQLLKEKKAGKQVKDALLVGYPNYGTEGSIAPLPGTESELRGVAAVLSQYEHDITLLQQDNASEALLKEKANRPALLHIATHGFFQQDADSQNNEFLFGVSAQKAEKNPLLRAGLMLANAEQAIDGKRPQELNSSNNGILTAYEVSTMPLEGTELVVLSACETGLGEIKAGEGVYGLQRAFQVAGAESLIMSLWKVSDDATQLLMQYFYQQWMQTGNKEAAFQQAQRKLKERYPNPYFWGAFVLLQ